MEIELIAAHHDRKGFHSRNAQLDRFLQQFARKYTQQNIGHTYVAIEAAGATEILGFYTIASGSIESEIVPANVPKHPTPVAHLGRLAVSSNHQGKGIGKFLLMDALHRAYQASRHIAMYAVEVIAKDETAKNFYLKYDFKELKDDKLRLYLSMKKINQLFH